MLFAKAQLLHRSKLLHRSNLEHHASQGMAQVISQVAPQGSSQGSSAGGGQSPGLFSNSSSAQLLDQDVAVAPELAPALPPGPQANHVPMLIVNVPPAARKLVTCTQRKACSQLGLDTTAGMVECSTNGCTKVVHHSCYLSLMNQKGYALECVGDPTGTFCTIPFCTIPCIQRAIKAADPKVAERIGWDKDALQPDGVTSMQVSCCSFMDWSKIYIFPIYYCQVLLDWLTTESYSC